MIPNLTIEALQNGFGHFGSASKERKPFHADALGLRLNQKENLLSCFIIEKNSKILIQNLNETKRVSYFCGLPSHEAYNFKGLFLEKFQLGEEDLKISKIFREEIRNTLLSLGISKDGAENMVGTPPDIGLTFRVEKIFKQTPGPEAGKELDFIL